MEKWSDGVVGTASARDTLKRNRFDRISRINRIRNVRFGNPVHPVHPVFFPSNHACQNGRWGGQHISLDIIEKIPILSARR